MGGWLWRIKHGSMGRGGPGFPLLAAILLMFLGNGARAGEYDHYLAFKYLQNYPTSTYGAQNWAILEDKRGILYIANQDGVLEYDGVSWRVIKVPNHTVRSMAQADDGTIYIGGRSEIGYLAPNARGELAYESLISHLKETDRGFGEVWQTHCHGDCTWFNTRKKLLRWQGGKLTAWDNDGESKYKWIFSWQGKCLVQIKDRGIMEIKADDFRKLPASDTFPQERVFMVVPYKGGKLLLGTYSQGLYLFDGQSTVTLTGTDADIYVRDKRLSHGIALGNGDFAAATFYGGVVIFDETGRINGIFDSRTTGLETDNVKYILEDSRGSLWLALNNGISRIDYGSPSFYFGKNSGLKGLVLCTARYNGQLYAGTDAGLYYLDNPGPGKVSRFSPVPGITRNCWSLLALHDSLIVASDQGIMQVMGNNQVRQITSGKAVLALAASHITPGRIWAAGNSGVSALVQKQNGWCEESRVDCGQPDIRSLVEDQDGNLWLGTITNGAWRIECDRPGQPGTPQVHGFGEESGLPAGEVHVTMISGQPVFATPQGLFRFAAKTGRFLPFPLLGEDFCNGSRGIFRLAQAEDGRIWFHSSRENFCATPLAGTGFTVRPVTFPMLRFSQANAITPDGPLVWFACNEGLVGYDTGMSPAKDFSFSARVRQVTTKDGQPIYGGFRSGQQEESLPPVLEYKDRHLRFSCAAPFFEGKGEVKYRYWMEGFDKGWSMETDESSKTYTNLDSGRYTFKVQAQDVYGTGSTPDTFSFRILPPFYLTWWAYILYGITAILFVYLVVKWRSYTLVKEKQRLERVVDERTQEINRANIELQQKTILLQEQSEQLKEMDQVKSRFFANISHEFRTPLSLIMGPLEQIRTAVPTQQVKSWIDLAYGNARRLLGLINQLLDLAKLESGKMKLQAEERDVVAFLKALLEPFELAAQQKQVNLAFDTEKATIPLYFDVEKMEKIMINLLSNALKFTPEGGTIGVSVTLDPAGGSTGYAVITVKDTGPGIPADQLSRIFDRFYQVPSPVEHRQKGSGIGLSLTKELVDLHRGEIGVNSRTAADGESGSGTEFYLRLPLGSAHLSPAELVAEPVSADQSESVSSAARDAVEEVAAEEVIETENAGSGTPGEAVKHPDKDVILVVEDNADLRYYIRTSLGSEYDVEEANDGADGIDKARAVIPDLIISDIMMPGTDGYELCRMVKNDVATSHIPVILLTAKTSESSILQGLEVGADDYITKPFNTRVLCARVKNLIALRRQLQLSLNREMVLQPAAMTMSKIDQAFFDELQRVIEKKMSDSELNVEDLSRRLAMSRTTVYRKILALTGETPTDFIRSYRLKRAAQLLKNNFGSITEVAFEVGFTSRAYFTQCFKEKFHLLPSEYLASFSG